MVLLCDDCQGTGEVTCGRCEGKGNLVVECEECHGDGCARCDSNGTLQVECHDCNGSGMAECDDCEGKGMKKEIG